MHAVHLVMLQLVISADGRAGEISPVRRQERICRNDGCSVPNILLSTLMFVRRSFELQRGVSCDRCMRKLAYLDPEQRQIVLSDHDRRVVQLICRVHHTCIFIFSL